MATCKKHKKCSCRRASYATVKNPSAGAPLAFLCAWLDYGVSSSCPDRGDHQKTNKEYAKLPEFSRPERVKKRSQLQQRDEAQDLLGLEDDLHRVNGVVVEPPNLP